MSNTKDFVLIKGNFSPRDAKDILLCLIDDKIRYHSLRNFSAQERFGEDDAYCQKRLGELRESRAQLAALLEAAIDNHTELKIDSMIRIEPLEVENAHAADAQLAGNAAK